jgi:hypothetical protein
MEILLDVFISTIREINFEFYEEPNDVAVNLTDKRIDFRMCDENWQEIMLSYNSVEHPELFTFDQACTHKMKFTTTEAMTSEPGRFMVEFEISKSAENFREFFQYVIVVRETLKHGVPSSP